MRLGTNENKFALNKRLLAGDQQCMNNRTKGGPGCNSIDQMPFSDNLPIISVAMTVGRGMGR